MPYATGLRLLAAVCYFSIIGIPFGLLFHYLARKKEKERQKELDAQQALLKQANGE